MASLTRLCILDKISSILSMGFDSIPDTLTKNVKPELPFSGDSRYLTRLCVFENEEQLSQSESAQPSGFELRDDNINPHKKIVTQDKIIAVLKLLTFREQHVIVQFWSPAYVVGKLQVLTTIDQPFGLGEITEQLTSYRKESQYNLYVVDNDQEEDELSPPARVFRRRVPEWTLDVANYSPKQFPQKESAIRRDLHGYVALPVADLSTSSRVGVLEILTSSKYVSYAYEIQQVQSALKTANLITTQAFDGPTIHVHNAHWQNELGKIHNVLKFVCDTHRLPLAQTWATSPLTTFASHDQILKKSCSSFHTRCLGKVCMSTDALPYYVQDLRLWSFRKACKEQHLDKSSGFVGRALLSHGSYFCEDVTKLSQEEYLLVHYALMSGLSSCFAIFLHSIESNNDYVLEFFLSLNKEDSIHVQNLVRTLKHSIEIATGFELGDNVQVFGPPIEASSVFSNTDPQSNDVSNDENSTSNHDVSMQIASNIVTGAREESNHLKRGIKRKIDSLTVEAVNKHVGKPIDEAAKSLGVSRSTLKHFCQDNNLTGWPLPKHNKKTACTDSKLSRISGSKKNIQQSSNVRFGLFGAVILLVRIKRWSFASKRHVFSGNWWSCGKHGHLSFKSDSIYQVARLMIFLQRWKNKKSNEVSDTRKVTVKATFKDDMIKVQIPISSRLSELQNEVAHRTKLKSAGFRLKYKDDDDDLILLACDADLQNLLGGSSTSNNTTVKLIIQADD